MNKSVVADNLSNLMFTTDSIINKRTELVMQWIPAQYGFPGNDKGDELAKTERRTDSNPPPTTTSNSHQSFKEAKTLLKQSMQINW